MTNEIYEPSREDAIQAVAAIYRMGEGETVADVVASTRRRAALPREVHPSSA